MSDLVKGFHHIIPKSATTFREVGGCVSEDGITEVLNALGESGYPDQGKVCYVFGMGDQSRATYDELKSHAGVSVLYLESALPRVLRLIPSHRGLVKIENPARLQMVFERLMESSTVGVYIFDARYETRFLDAVRNVDKTRDRTFGIESDPGYLIYLVDADREDSSSGMIDFLSYGKDGPWRTILALHSEQA